MKKIKFILFPFLMIGFTTSANAAIVSTAVSVGMKSATSVLLVTSKVPIVSNY